MIFNVTQKVIKKITLRKYIMKEKYIILYIIIYYKINK